MSPSPIAVAALLMVLAGSATTAIQAASLDELAGRLDAPEAAAGLLVAGEAAVAPLSKVLNGPRPDLAVLYLGRLGTPSASAALAGLAGDADGELRASVAWALGRCGGPAAEAALARLVDDAYPPARVAALMALAGAAGRRAGTDGGLTRALGDQDERVKLAAIAACRAGKRTDLLPALAALLDYDLVAETDAQAIAAGKPAQRVAWKAPSEQVRLAVIATLGAFDLIDVVPVLIAALERETSFNRRAIVAVLKGMGERAVPVCLGRIVTIPYDQAAFRAYMPLLINNGTLACIAGVAGDARCVPHLLDTLALPRNNLGADQDLTDLFVDTIPLLGRYRVDRAAIPLVKLLMETRVKQIAEATQVALRQIGRSAARPLATSLENWQMAPIVFRLLREPDLRTAAARDAILRFISHESDEVRFEATETLGLYILTGLLDEYDLQMLDAMMLDSNAEVRASCARWKAQIAKKNTDG